MQVLAAPLQHFEASPKSRSKRTPLCFFGRGLVLSALLNFALNSDIASAPLCAPIRDITTIHPMTSSEGLWNREGERFRSFEVDDQLELGRLFDGEIGGLCAFQYFVGVGHCAAKKIGNIWSVQHQQMMGQTGTPAQWGLSLSFLRENQVPVFPIGFRHRFLPLASAIAAR